MSDNPKNLINGVDLWSGPTRDCICLIREAIEQTKALSEFEVSIVNKDWNLSIKGKRK